MSFVNAVPEYVAAAATDLANIGSTISSASAAALAPTSGVLAAGADEVSASIAALFGAHAQAYQALSSQAALFHQQFVQLMDGGAAQYAITEAANASPMQTAGQGVLAAIDAPSQAQTGYALTSKGVGVPGIGANGASGGSGTAGQAGGSGGAGTAGQVGSTGGGRLIGGTAGSGGIGPAAVSVGNGGASGWFGAGGGVAGTGSSPVGGNLGGVGVTGANSGLVASAGAGEAAESAQGLGIGESGATVAAAPDAEVTPVPAVPAAMPVHPPATARPAAPRPAYSPATAAAASAEERPAATAGT